MRTVIENRNGINQTKSFEEYLRKKLSNSQEKEYVVEPNNKSAHLKSKFIEELINQFCK